MNKIALLLLPVFLVGCATHYENEVPLYDQSDVPRQRGSIPITLDSDHKMVDPENRKKFAKKYEALDKHIEQGLAGTGFRVVKAEANPDLTLSVSCQNQHIGHGPQWLTDMGKVTRRITIAPWMLVGGYVSETRAMTCDMSLIRKGGNRFDNTYAESFESFKHVSPLGIFAMPFNGVAGADGACKVGCLGGGKHEKVMAAKLVTNIVHDSVKAGFFEGDAENHIPEVFDLSGASDEDTDA